VTAVLIPADVRFPLERANGVQIVKTAAALARAGAETTLLVRDTDPRPTSEILPLFGVDPGGLRVRRLAVLHRRGSFHVPRAAFLARAGLACFAALRRGAVVYTRDLQLADLVLSLRGRARLVYEAHAVESVLYRERGVLYGTADQPQEAKAARLRRREERVWRRARALVATTAGIRDTFAEEFGPRAAVAVIPNGCDVPAARTFPGLAAEDPPRVLYAGQLYPWKGVDVLVDAVARVARARLVILGGIEGEADLARVRARVSALGIADRVEMRGLVPQAEVARELMRARVVAVPVRRSAMTLRHTSPLKAFEAMAAGRPLIASDLPSSREFLRHGENAWLVAPDDVEALAAGISTLLADDALSERLGRAAFEDAALYSWDARARRLLEVFTGTA
jgi:glycosyltransferase involved in cell wall biosynthesis